MGIKVVVVGDIGARLSVQTERLPRPHQTVPGYGLVQSGTGTGALQAVAAARLGAEVCFIGHVGADVVGDYLIKLLTDAGIDTTHITHDDTAASGVVLGFAEGEKAMFADVPGANAKLTEQHIRAASDAIKTADVLVTALAVPQGAVERALQIASDAKIRRVLKPVPLTSVTDRLLQLPDVLTPNEEELRALAQQADQREAVPGQLSVCTLGKAGAQWFRQPTEGGEMQSGRVNGFTVRAIDVTGAGAVFSAALGVALAEGQPTEDAIRFANAAGALTTTQRGTWGALPTRDAVEALLKR